MRVFTIGFTRKTAEQFFALLRGSGAKRVLDVRLNNVSQLAGFAKRDDLQFFLRELCGLDYVHVPELAPTPALLQRHRQVRGGWEEYARGFVELLHAREVERTLSRELIADGCLLCSEHEPEHCHRRLAAEYLRERWGEPMEIRHLR